MYLKFCVAVAWSLLTGGALAASFWQTGSLLVMSNANVVLKYDLTAGTTAFSWNNSQKISAFYSGVGLKTGYVKGINFSNRTWSTVSNNQVSVTAHAVGLPIMTQYFTLDQPDSFLTQVSMTGSGASANWMGPVVVDATGGVDIGITNDNRALFVPFDNDHFVSYNSENLNGSDVGNEVGAFYDNVSRHGLVVGSVTHDTWKTGIYWYGTNNKLNQLNVFGGQTWTWDVMAHGYVSGAIIYSPTVFVGFGNDWRLVMENFADANTRVVPALRWTNGVPFGWNSWGVTNFQDHISYAAAIGVSDSIHTNLQAFGFTNDGTVYVNLDSYWDNLWTDYGGTQLQSFVAHCHANGQKAGVYLGPFVYWGTADQATNSSVPVGYPPNNSLYHFSDILLRTTSGALISNDGAYAIDPTHPGSRGYIDYYAYWFTNWGFDYVKFDFLSHAALEGVHYDTNITTGIQAYNQGMQYLLNKFNGRVFISESIAPIFPYQYGHSRRIACDAGASLIGNTAYTMNAVSLGWWIGGRLYPFNDPDMMTFDNGPDTNEVQSRLINCAVTGVYLNGSILTNAASIKIARTALTNAGINAVARIGQTFRPVDGATGTDAANVLERQDGRNWSLAVFNYTSGATNESINLAFAGLPTAHTFAATDLWNQSTLVVSNTMSVALNAKQARLFRLGLNGPTPLPAISTAAFDSAGNFVGIGSNGIPGWSYVVLASTNLATPLSQWTALATNYFDGAGNFSFTNGRSRNLGPTFQRLEIP
jgi:alpha-galactosidase